MPAAQAVKAEPTVGATKIFLPTRAYFSPAKSGQPIPHSRSPHDEGFESSVRKNVFSRGVPHNLTHYAYQRALGRPRNARVQNHR